MLYLWQRKFLKERRVSKVRTMAPRNSKSSKGNFSTNVGLTFRFQKANFSFVRLKNKSGNLFPSLLKYHQMHLTVGVTISKGY